VFQKPEPLDTITPKIIGEFESPKFYPFSSAAIINPNKKPKTRSKENSSSKPPKSSSKKIGDAI